MAKKLKIADSKTRKTAWVLSSGRMMRSDEAKGMRIELFSNRELNVEGCRGVMDYNEDYIKLRLKKGSITVMGKELVITFYEGDAITLKGIIGSIEFCV